MQSITKITLPIEIGNAQLPPAKHLQIIKDAMVNAIMLQIDSTGITDAQDSMYSIYQQIYLEAHTAILHTYTDAEAGEAPAQ